MDSNDFTSGPIRDLSPAELGSASFSDFELLSDSGHNLVYRALLDGKWEVLKAAKQEEGNTARNRLLLRREYDIMRAADCIYVVHMWQMVDLPSLGPAIVMEYVYGRTLAQFMQEKPSVSDRRRVVNELLEALASLHDRQIIHGDLKSSNILITETGNHVRLIDFGFADTDAYVAKNIGSSPSILPPEQSAHDATDAAETADIQRDIYAFGEVLKLLFPHRFAAIRRNCLTNRYHSVHQIQKALTLRRRMNLVISLLCLLALVLCLAVFGTRSAIERNMPAPQRDTVLITTTVHHRDTIMVAPPVDSLWLQVKSQADSRYALLYRTYKDSITNMPQKDLIIASEMTSRYATSMLKAHDELIAAYPKYENELHSQYLRIYTRDYPKLNNITKDYPLVVE